MSELFLVSTPIGNLADMTFRAVDILNKTDFVICEDSRVSGRLMKHFNIETRMIVYNDHNKKTAAKRIIELLKDSKRCALITDAGTPSISDPGYYIVNRCIEENIEIVSVPGASALTAAVSISGLPTDKFVFYGFLPRKKNARKSMLSDAVKSGMTSVFYESPYRIDKVLQEIVDISENIRTVICREMTKLHEETIRGTAFEVLSDKWKRKGEIVLLINGVKYDS